MSFEGFIQSQIYGAEEKLNLQCITNLKVCGGNSTNMLIGTLLVLLNFLPCNVYTKLCLSVSHSDYIFVGAL